MKHKGIKLAILGVLLFGSGLGIFSNNFRSAMLLDEKIDYTNESTLKSTGPWNLTGSPISIDDSDPGKNWVYTASYYDWCSGMGNWADPYLIENVIIDGQDSGSCIEIMNSDAYFIIRNCTLFYGWHLYGVISLLNTNNGRLIDNICSANIGNGIRLSNSHNNTLSGNIAFSNRDGIYLDDSHNNMLSGNTVDYNKNGIYLDNSHDNTLSGNTASNNDEIGIEISSSDHNTLSGNTVNNNWNGMRITNSHNNTLSGNDVSNNDSGIDYLNYEYGIIFDGCYYNTLSGNTVSNNDYGIVLSSSDYNTLSENTANNNNDYGIWLYDSHNNTLSGNTLIGNTECIIEDNSYDNIFENNDCDGGDGIITGYNLFFLLGILSVVAILTSKKIKKS